MNKTFRKCVYWFAILSIYALSVIAVLRLLSGTELEQPSTLSDTSLGADKSGGIQSLYELVGQPGELSGVLLPLGPAHGHLPGDHAIWHEFGCDRQQGNENDDKNGFDGLQAVDQVSDFFAGAVSELFLAGTPRQVFRRGHFLYLLNGDQRVQVIDCKDPRKPRLMETLPYIPVKHMVQRGGIAYLLQGRQDDSFQRLIVVDLKNPGKPRELARLDLPKGAFSFFFVDDQLVVYTIHTRYDGKNRVNLYDLGDNFQLRLLGSAESPNLGDNFILYDEYVVAPGTQEGLSVYDFSDPLNYVQIASLNSPRLNRLARHADMLFATGPNRRLSAIDFQDPQRPQISTVAADVTHPAYLLAYGGYTYYFTFNGYLRVFDLPLGFCLQADEPAAAVDGALIALSPDAGFTLLGKAPDSLPANISGVLPLPEALDPVDQLVWQGSLVLLGKDGILRFYQINEDSSLMFWQELQLEGPQRWLAAGDGYLYAGGEGSVSVVAVDKDASVSVAGHLELSGAATWDGLVVEKTLFLAAGKEGLLSYSLEQPDAPVAGSGWTAPRHLQPQVDVRQLASVDDERVLFTAGDAGLFSGRMGADGGFRLEGSFRFSSPARAVALHDGLALVSTSQMVSVVDIRDEHSFQALGEIAFPGVEKIAVSAANVWAGYVASMGWSFLPLPRFFSPAEANALSEMTQPSEQAQERYGYRLHLFNDRGVKTVPMQVPFSGKRTKLPAAGGPLVH